MSPVKPAPHECDLRFTIGQHPSDSILNHGLKPYYAMHQLMSEWDGWKTQGKPTESINFNGEEWALCFDYEESGLDPWDSPSFEIENVREFRFYFVSKDSPTYQDKTADKDPRVKGGTITIRPRWPDMTSDGEPVSVPDYGGPYIDAQIQASNIPHGDYLDLLKRIMSAFGISQRYFSDPHPDSHISDMAYYVRLERGESGPIFAADGPIARSHALLESDREGYRKHVEDHTEIPGYYVTTTLSDSRARELIDGHDLGKELKHYYPNHPDSFDPNEPGYHPKFEVSYQSSRTEQTLRWSELDNAREELVESLLNAIEWAGISTSPDNEIWVENDPFWNVEHADDDLCCAFVNCPLPEIENEQEHRVMKLWGSMQESDKEVVDLLLSDGGKVSPKDAAEETGYSYKTIRNVIDRLEGLIRHGYDEMGLESKKIRDELLKRTKAAAGNFKNEIERVTMDVADAVENYAGTAWGRLRRQYAITVDRSAECRKLLKVDYNPTDELEARNVIREINTAYQEIVEESTHGIHVEIELSNGERRRFNSLEAAFRAGGDLTVQKERTRNSRARQDFDFEAWKAAGCPPGSRYDPGG